MSYVVVGIIIKAGKEPAYLLVSSKTDFGKYTGYYYPPGGHIEEGEDEITALKREIREELGIKLFSAEKITDTVGDVKNQKTSWYLCETSSYDLAVDDELHDAGFFTKEQMASMNIWPATKSVFDKFIFNK